MNKRKIREYTSFDYDFEHLDGENIKIDKSYKYERRDVWSRALSFVLYRLIAPSAAFLCLNVIKRERYVGKKKLRGSKGGFLFGNHVSRVADAVTPSLVSFPRRTSIVVHPDNLAMPVLGGLLPYLGAMPLPGDFASVRAFSDSIAERIGRGEFVALYPEAHVWHGYTGIRPFADGSFGLPVRLNAECFALTRVFKRTLLGYRSVVYIDGPFRPDPSLGRRESSLQLKEQIRSVMQERAKLSDIEPIKYVRVNESSQPASKEEKN